MVAVVVEEMHDGVPAHKFTAVLIFITVSTGDHGEELAIVVHADGVGPVTRLVRNRDHLGQRHEFHGRSSSKTASSATINPTTSSSRSRPGLKILMHVWLYALLTALVGVGPRRSLKARIPRSSPHTAPTRSVVGHRCAVAASRRASFARPGRARLVQVERLTSRTTWTRRARSGCLRCAMGCQGADIPERWGSGRSPGRRRPCPGPLGPEALPARGVGPKGCAHRHPWLRKLMGCTDMAARRMLIVMTKLVQVDLRSNNVYRTCWVEPRVRVGDQVTLKDSVDPGRRWDVLRVGAVRSSNEIKRGWNNNI
jgi:hypothetical protein